MSLSAWDTFPLGADGNAPAPSGAPLTMVPEVHAQRTQQQAWGTGFVVHPNIVITAAHVVTFWGATGLCVADQLWMDFGGSSLWGTQVALPQGYLAQSGGSGTLDVAVIRVDSDICDSSLTLTLSPLGSGVAPVEANVWGYATGALASVDVVASRPGDLIVYPAQDMPGSSGGPVTSPRGTIANVSVLGVHRHFDGTRVVGEAVALALDDVRAAMQALGFQTRGNS
jgi:hypothetical protein